MNSLIEGTLRWQQVKWGNLATLEYGKGLRNYHTANGNYPVYGTNGPIGWYVSPLSKQPGIIIGRKGAYRGVHLSKTPFYVIDTAFYLNLLTDEVDLTWAYYQLLDFDINKLDSGSAIPSTSREAFYQIPVLLPPLPTQRKIAAILSAYDDLIENNTRRITLLEEMAQSLYREWFVHFRFPGHEKKRMVESALGMIPEGWEVVKCSEVVEVDPPTRILRVGSKPFVSMAGLSVNSMLIDSIEQRTGNSGSKFRNGDTLFARITPCLENGKTGYVQFLPAEASVAFGSTEFIVLRSKTLCPEYVYLMARSHEFRDNAIKSMSGATGRQRVQISCFDKFFLAQPDSQTLNAFHELTSPLFKSAHILSQKNANLRQTRDLLLPKLVSGEIDVEGLAISDVESEAAGGGQEAGDEGRPQGSPPLHPSAPARTKTTMSPSRH
jgi:type I restriction enzyme S subunit